MSAEAYPLAWPAGWPRAKRKARAALQTKPDAKVEDSNAD
jgi:hypothetical protein